MLQDWICGMTEPFMPNGRRCGDEGMTIRASDMIKRPEAITTNERTMSLIIKNCKTIKIKINRAIVMSSKLANIYNIFNEIRCDKSIW